jgi:hypothetical protein
VTLNRAHRVLLVEPLHHFSVECQNADRVHRFNVQTDMCLFYRLINTESKLEKALVDAQEAQNHVQCLIESLQQEPSLQQAMDDPSTTAQQLSDIADFVEQDVQGELD